MTDQDTAQRRAIDLIMVEDSAVDAELVVDALLEAGLAADVRRTDDEPTFRAALDERLPDAILADWTLPKISGRRALEIARERCPDVGVIFVSGTISEVFASEVLRQGAIDYVYKHQLQRLGPVLIRVIDEARTQRSLHESEEKYRQLFETSRDALMVLIPPSWWFADANQATLQMFGADSKADFIALGPWDVSPERQPDGRLSTEKSQEKIATALREGSHVFKWEHRRLNSETFPADVLLTRIEAYGQVFLQATVRDITERKRAEEEIKVLAKFPAEDPDPVMRISTDGTLLYINESGSGQLSEWNLQVGRIAPPYLRDAVSRVMNDGSREILDLEHGESTYSFSVMPVRDAGYANLYGRNITERKRSEQTQARLAAMLDATPGFVGFADAKDTHILYINPAGRKMIGVQAQEDVPQLKIADVHPEWTNKLFRDEIIPSTLRDGMWTGECAFLNRDGREIPVMMVLLAHKSPSGVVERFSTISIDITERKRAEEEIKVLAKFPAEDPDPVMRISTDGTLLYINESGSGQLSEWNLQVGRIAPPYLRDAVSRVMNEGSRETLDLEHGESTYSFSVMPVRDAGYANLYGRNITERKRGEEALAQSLEQLRQSQKIEAVGRLAGGIAHDFNNLLTVITGYCELIMIKIEEGNPLLQDLQEISKSADRAAALTRQLLAFSRRQILQPKVLEIDTLVPEMDKMLRRLIGEDIDLVTNLGAGTGKVKFDPGQIEQVIVNLVINSRDAMPDGGAITIETANVELDQAFVRKHGGAWPGPHVMLAVSDTGFGMDPETLSKAFDPFFTTKEKGKGTGLGLSTVFGIVKQSGGCIYVYSEPGRGTTMKIYLPRVTGETSPKDERRDAGFEERLHGSETILLVEDDETLRKLASSILEGYGYTVLSAENGEEALQLLSDRQGIPHLVLTDVVMPKMSGRGLSDRIKSIHPGTRVLFMSGYTDNAIVHHGVLDPGVSFLQKPFTPKALARKVREVLDKA